MQTGYFVQLMLDGQLAGAVRTKTDDDYPGDLMTLELPSDAFDHEGVYELNYRATNDKSEQHTDSPITRLLVDRTAPGAVLLAPMIFAQVNFGESLAGLVPGYAAMAIGDRIQTLCNGVQGPVYQVGSEDLAQRAMHISFSREYLQSLDSPAITVTYQVTDRAGNQSRLARPGTLSMQI